MTATKFTAQNTRGYTEEQLSEANRLYAERVQGLDLDSGEGQDESSRIAERVLEEVEQRD